MREKSKLAPQMLPAFSERLLREENLTVEHPQPKNVFLVNVDLLTDSEVSKLYRIALDSVELNKKLAEQVVIQQSTESSLMDLSIKLGEKGTKDFHLTTIFSRTMLKYLKNLKPNQKP